MNDILVKSPTGSADRRPNGYKMLVSMFKL